MIRSTHFLKQRNHVFSRIHRILSTSVLQSKFMTAEEAAELIPNKCTLAFSGFTPSGYPKAVPTAYANRIEREPVNTRKSKFAFNVFTGASTGDELDGALVRTGCMKLRIPYQTHVDLRSRINKGEVDFVDFHLSSVARMLRMKGVLPPIDVAIIEASDITPDGKLYLTHAVGLSPTYINSAKKIIIELNERVPANAMREFFDIYEMQSAPDTQPIPITSVSDRIGTSHVQIKGNLNERLIAIVRTNMPDSTAGFRQPDEISNKIASHILDFLNNEIVQRRLPRLLPIQSGVGNVANAVLSGLIHDQRYQDIEMYTEVLQDSIFDLIDSGKLKFASSTSLTLSKSYQDRLHNEIHKFKNKLLLRPQEISNNPEVIRRLGLIAMNTALEVDIYGNVNSTHVLGSQMMNGIGGSGDFTRNALISIFMAPSCAKKGSISAFVPMVTHCDHNEHSVSVVVSEQGLADLRGLSPVKRAHQIINKCAHPRYKEYLRDYLKEATNVSVGKHTPHDLLHGFDWHNRYIRTGSMLPA
ncbi:hypothetical protein GJ496_008442 [Pomphorhynchus laevis]|nr:hypothetical protein GJ496_008442 [Pomphorhynchus laevis]